MIEKTFKPGDKVFYVPQSEEAKRLAAQVGSQGSFNLPESMRRLLADGKAFRKQAIVDRVIDAETVRLILCDTYDHVWASPMEVEHLDMVSQIADIETSKSIEQQLAEVDSPAPE